MYKYIVAYRFCSKRYIIHMDNHDFNMLIWVAGSDEQPVDDIDSVDVGEFILICHTQH